MALDSLSIRGFRRLVALLRQDFPTDHAVEVRRRTLKTCRARHRIHPREKIGPRGGKTYPLTHIIVIDKDVGVGDCFESLFHEWAHALRWEQNPNAGHDDTYWKFYGRMYRKYLDD